jgi:hypothetical protein
MSTCSLSLRGASGASTKACTVNDPALKSGLKRLGYLIGPLPRETYRAFGFFGKYLILCVFIALDVQKNT